MSYWDEDSNNFIEDLDYLGYFEEESDEESTAIMEVNQIKKASSDIHRLLRSFQIAHPSPSPVLAANLGLFGQLMGAGATAEMWGDLAAARDAFDITLEFADKIPLAQAVSDAYIALRNGAGLQDTIIANNMVNVSLSGVTAANSLLLVELEDLVKRKMSGRMNAPAQNVAASAQMVNDLVADLNLAMETGDLPGNYFRNNRLWKIHQAAARLNPAVLIQALPGVKPPDCPRSDAQWTTFVQRYNTEVARAPEGGVVGAGQFAGASNKFAVDVWCCFIMHCKTINNNVTLETMLQILRDIANYTRQSRIGGLEWNRMVTRMGVNSAYIAGLNARFTLWDNPAKLTKNRLMACAATLFHSADSTFIFSVPQMSTLSSGLIASIYKIEKDAGLVIESKAETSTSEHLMHLLLVMGTDNGFWMNRNQIPGSARQVTFTINPEAEPVVGE